MGDMIECNASPPSSAAATPPASNNRSLPVREDCWSEGATVTLVEAWGRRYVELNRGNLRQKDWQEVADIVNSLHGHSKKTYRTDVQCKNRIDTVKKKYKVEKARVVASNGTYVSSWIFFNRLDVMIGPTTPASSGAGGGSHGGLSSSSGKKAGQQQHGSPVPLAMSPPVGVPLLQYRKAVPIAGVGVGPGPVVAMAAAVSLPRKRERERERDIRRNYSEVAAAAAAAENMEEDDDELNRESEEEEELEKESNEEGEEGGMRRLAKAIERFGEVYSRVEGEKLRQMVELEKQRMQFAKDLEVQRLKMFMDTQVQMERLKHSKRTDSDGEEEKISSL